MKWVPWVLACCTSSAAVTALVWTWREDVERKFLRSATEELLADLRDAVEERRGEIERGELKLLPEDGVGDLKPLADVSDLDRFMMELGRRRDADGNLVRHGYFEGRSAYAQRNRFLDGWGREMRHEVVDGRYRAVSAGDDGIFGTADDLNSDLARSRFAEPVKAAKKKPDVETAVDPADPADPSVSGAGEATAPAADGGAP